MKNEKKLDEKKIKKEYTLKIKKTDGSILEVEIPWFSEEFWATVPDEQKVVRYINPDMDVCYEITEETNKEELIEKILKENEGLNINDFYYPNENDIYIGSIEELKSVLIEELIELNQTRLFKIKADLIFNHSYEIKEIFSEYREKFQHS